MTIDDILQGHSPLICMDQGILHILNGHSNVTPNPIQS